MNDSATILIASSAHERLEHALSQAGYTIRAASGAREALDILERTPVHLVLLDLRLSDRSGLNLLRSIRAADRTRHLTVVMLTTNHSVDEESAAFDASADDFVVLEPDLTGLLARIGARVRRGQPAVSAVDSVTGLPNRLLLAQRLEHTFEHSTHEGHAAFAVLLLDLDGFKVLNDRIGLIAGDDLLRAVAQRLESCLRASDQLDAGRADRTGAKGVGDTPTLARVGGDEFIVLLPNVRSVLDAMGVADRIQLSLASPFRIDGRDVFVAVSIGIALSGQRATRPDDVLRDADAALHRAKVLGKGRTEVFDVLMREQVDARLAAEEEIRIAVDRHEFTPHYQPIVDMQTGRVVGVEALARWAHPSRGVLPAAEFVPLLEDTGLVHPVGRHLLRHVCRELSAWRATYPQAARLWAHVNMASRQLVEPGLVTDLLEILDETGLPPEHLVIEITDATAASAPAVSVAVLRSLRDAGIRVVLDDFGAGHASIARLESLPISGVTLDPTFVRRHRGRPAMLRAVVELSHALGLTVTAKGIDSNAAFDELRAAGCEYAQGCLLAPALDAAATAATLASPRSLFPSAVALSSARAQRATPIVG